MIEEGLLGVRSMIVRSSLLLAQSHDIHDHQHVMGLETQNMTEVGPTNGGSQEPRTEQPL
jgi:hypothetical protein